MGREDHQVNILGHRVELAEIEQAMARLLPSNKLVVTACQLGRECKLVAWVVADALKARGMASGDLQKALAEWLPEYWIPAVVNLVSHIPMTSNGKVDRAALKHHKVNEPMAAQSTGYSSTLLSIIQHEFGLECLPDPYDSFDQFGMDSINVIHLVTELKRQLGWNIALAQIRPTMTAADLAELVGNQCAEEVDLYLTFNPEQRSTLYCFPPASSFGFAYQALAEQLSDYRLIAYHFPEGVDDVVELYSRHILQHHSDGPLRLMGYSGGGNLAVAVAARLAESGLQTDQVIVIDAFKQQGCLDHLPATVLELQQQMVRHTIADLAEQGLQPLRVQERIEAYYRHHWLLRDSHALQLQAQLVVMQAGEPDVMDHICSDPEVAAVLSPSWAGTTTGDFITAHGRGNHQQMLKAPYVIDNARQLNPILAQLDGRECA